jgi:hypothetical protein
MARATASYSGEDDLLIGDMPLGSAYPPLKFIDAASDEVDSYLGRMFDVPIDLDEAGAVVILTLKRINNWLASGRLIMSVGTAGQDNELHAYGWSLVKQAMDELQAIMSGELTLPGLALIDTASIDSGSGPTVKNVDPVSRVDAFYGNHTYESSRYLDYSP